MKGKVIIMIKRHTTVKLERGLHARPASKFVELCTSFKSKILLRIGDREADPKSIINLLMLGVNKGAEIELSAEGEDEDAAIEALCEFVQITDESAL